MSVSSPRTQVGTQHAGSKVLELPRCALVILSGDKRGTETVIEKEKFLIGKSGSVSNISIVRGPSGLGFEEEALRAVSGWRYETPTIGGQPVAAWCVVPIRFTLD